jgi:hypothetical protein
VLDERQVKIIDALTKVSWRRYLGQRRSMANYARRQVYGRGCGGLPVYTSARIEATLAGTRQRAAPHVAVGTKQESERCLRLLREDATPHVGSPGRMPIFAGSIASDRFESDRKTVVDVRRMNGVCFLSRHGIDYLRGYVDAL